jgi:hypothetical protein
MANGICFVVMGFHKKTDYSGDNPRTLDLDATYTAIIKPAVESCGLSCIRADEVSHSGIIDRPMYELLLRADLVIADISTANPNALYELGVRHALRPRSTIVIKEIDGKFIFDLNHLATLQYKHLGEDIGAREASQKREALAALIRSVLEKQEDDSPVYTYLQNLRGPMLAEQELKHVARSAAAATETVAQALQSARQAVASGRSDEARMQFELARTIQQEALQSGAARGAGAATDPYIVQQLALYTYKAEKPDPLSALERAWDIIAELEPLASGDPETLGIAGAIQKRLWKRLRKREHLDLAIDLYGRGFEMMRDYYNGENYALCLHWRADEQSDPDEADFDRRSARKVQQRIVTCLRGALNDGQAHERSDYPWMLATMANTLRALGDPEADAYEKQFYGARPAPTPAQRKSFEDARAHAVQMSGI